MVLMLFILQFVVAAAVVFLSSPLSHTELADPSISFPVSAWSVAKNVGGGSSLYSCYRCVFNKVYMFDGLDILIVLGFLYIYLKKKTNRKTARWKCAAKEER